MNTFLSPKPPARIYRVDQFCVPEPAYAEFLSRLRDTHQFLRTLSGFVEDRVLEKSDGSGKFNFVTLVVWEEEAAWIAAGRAMAIKQAADGFDREAMFRRLGIDADFASYEAIDGESAANPVVAAECDGE